MRFLFCTFSGRLSVRVPDRRCCPRVSPILQTERLCEGISPINLAPRRASLAHVLRRDQDELFAGRAFSGFEHHLHTDTPVD
jgi:hypothetical protein